MKNKLIRLITILLSVSIVTTSFSLQMSASETISGVATNEWEYELKDDIMTWTFLKDDSDIAMIIENGVCIVDGKSYQSIYLIGMSWLIQNLICI